MRIHSDNQSTNAHYATARLAFNAQANRLLGQGDYEGARRARAAERAAKRFARGERGTIEVRHYTPRRVEKP